LLAAPGGGGKSTSCRLIDDSWQVLCDDEVLIVPGEKRNYQVHPFPTWSQCYQKDYKGTWNVQEHSPLKAVFFLKKSDKDRVIPLGQAKASLRLYESSLEISRRYWINIQSDQRQIAAKKLFDNTCKLSKRIPSFILEFTIGGRFWDKIEKVV